MSLVKKGFMLFCVAAIATLVLLPASSSYGQIKAPKFAKPAKVGSSEDEAPEDDIFVVPDGNPKEMIAYLKKLRKSCPNPRQDRRGYINFLIKSAKPTWEAADKVLSAKKATKKQKDIAVKAKFGALNILMRMRNKDAAEEMKNMPKELKKLGMPELARTIEWILFQQEVRKTLAGAPDAKPLKELIKTLKAKMSKTPDQNGLGLVRAIADEIKENESVEKAVAFCNEFEELIAKSDSKDASAMVKKIKGIVRRMQLMGNTMDIEGSLVDGKSFDLSEYKGKVVLVQFWATWCGPCRHEIPNVLKYYKLYHDRGFEVVSISLDRNRADLEKFLKTNKLPWPVIFEDGKKNAGFNTPMAVRYAVSGIPTLILIDSEGKVVSEKARGSNLGKELKKLLGPAEEEDKDDKSEE